MPYKETPNVATKEAPKAVAKAQPGLAEVSGRFQAADGWRNVHLYGAAWRCNRWELAPAGWVISESFHATATPDGLVIL